MTASSAPTSTVSSSATVIPRRIPETGEGISVSTLSVDTSSSGSSAVTWSPSCLSQRVTVPSVTLSPSCGMDTETDMACADSFVQVLAIADIGSGMEVQRFAGEREVRFTDRLRLARMRMYELCYLGGQRLPVVNQLALGDQLADPGANQVHPEHGTATRGRDDLSGALSLQDDALPVGSEVVGDLGGLDPSLGRCRRGDADRGYFRVAVSHPRDAVVVDGRDRQPGEPLGDGDALGEADMGELQARSKVADGGDRRNAGPPVLIDQDEAAVHRHARFRIAEFGRDGSAADADQHHIALDRGAVLQAHGDSRSRLLDIAEGNAEVVIDAAPAEGPLQQLRARLLLRRQQVRQH